MPIDKRFFLFGVISVFITTGCATSPVAYVGAYGDYREYLPTVSSVLEQHQVEVRDVETGPPAGVASPIIIHGSSREAARIANEIAYSLHKELGIWIRVRPVSVANHQYSPYAIGIYLVSDDRPSTVAGSHERGFSVVPTRLYEGQVCEDFLVSLYLAEEGKFSISGDRFDDADRQKRISLVGRYRYRDGVLVLEHAGTEFRYRRELVQHSQSENAKRERFVRSEKPQDPDSVFACSFLQEFDVLARQ